MEACRFRRDTTRRLHEGTYTGFIESELVCNIANLDTLGLLRTVFSRLAYVIASYFVCFVS